MRKMLNALLDRYGYTISKKSVAVEAGQEYVLHRYLDAEGKFDYARYKEVQTRGNKKKLESVWVDERHVEFLSGHITRLIGRPIFGICHGTRRGLEQQWFAKYLGCKVIGTEISDTATQFPNTIQWDFHDVKPEWVDSVDFIYSNSFDHSFDPERCLNAWMSCVRPGGVCVLEHDSGHGISGATELDPFGVDLAVLPYLVLKWGRGKFAVREILDAPVNEAGVSPSRFVCIQRN